MFPPPKSVSWHADVSIQDSTFKQQEESCARLLAKTLESYLTWLEHQSDMACRQMIESTALKELESDVEQWYLSDSAMHVAPLCWLPRDPVFPVRYYSYPESMRRPRSTTSVSGKYTPDPRPQTEPSRESSTDCAPSSPGQQQPNSSRSYLEADPPKRSGHWYRGNRS